MSAIYFYLWEFAASLAVILLGIAYVLLFRKPQPDKNKKPVPQLKQSESGQ